MYYGGFGDTHQTQLAHHMALNPMFSNMMPSGVINGVFSCTGNANSLPARIQGVPDKQISSIRQINLTIFGNQVKQMNICCLIWTIVLGSILIFPLFFMCCGWWLRIVNPAFQIDLSLYQSLHKLFSSSQLMSVNISVIDNSFNRQKAQVLFDMLSRSTARGFVFVNLAGPYNYKESQYDDFKANMNPIKSLSISSSMRWNNQIV